MLLIKEEFDETNYNIFNKYMLKSFSQALEIRLDRYFLPTLNSRRTLDKS